MSRLLHLILRQRQAGTKGLDGALAVLNQDETRLLLAACQLSADDVPPTERVRLESDAQKLLDGGNIRDENVGYAVDRCIELDRAGYFAVQRAPA